MKGIIGEDEKEILEEHEITNKGYGNLDYDAAKRNELRLSQLALLDKLVKEEWCEVLHKES